MQNQYASCTTSRTLASQSLSSSSWREAFSRSLDPAVAIVRQNGRSSASCRASVAVTPVSRQIWHVVQVVDGVSSRFAETRFAETLTLTLTLILNHKP